MFVCLCVSGQNIYIYIYIYTHKKKKNIHAHIHACTRIHLQEEYTRHMSTADQTEQEHVRAQHAKVLAEERAASLASQFDRVQAELDATRRLQHQTRDEMRDVEIKQARQVGRATACLSVCLSVCIANLDT